jgi:hypothetical protein
MPTTSVAKAPQTSLSRTPRPAHTGNNFREQRGIK